MYDEPEDKRDSEPPLGLAVRHDSLVLPVGPYTEEETGYDEQGHCDTGI